MMRHRKQGAVACGAVSLLAFIGAAVASSAPAAATPAPNLYVAIGGNDSGNACRLVAHPCATVPYALTQAPSGADVNVGAGTFTLPVHITQSVNIIGTVQSGSPATIFNPSTTVADTDSTYENSSPQTMGVLVDITNGATANLSNLVIKGNAASPSFDVTGCNDNFVGVYYHNASGTVTNVAIKGVELEQSLFGCQDGLGAYVATDTGSGTPSSVTFNGVTVKAYDKNGITCNDAGTTCTVTDSKVTGIGPTALIAQNGIQIAYNASGSVTGSTATANSYTAGGANNTATGILIYDTGATTVSGNTLSANDVNLSAGSDSGGTSGSWSISGNTVTGATDNVTSGQPGYGEGNGYGDGIQLYVDGAVNPTTVSGNTTTGNYEYGIGIYGSSLMAVSTNTSNTNYDGIYVDSASGSNTFTSNRAKKNLRYDYEDVSTGSGTSHTNDTWTTNTCKPLLDSAPTGLC